MAVAAVCIDRYRWILGDMILQTIALYMIFRACRDILDIPVKSSQSAGSAMFMPNSDRSFGARSGRSADRPT
jgi:hypothetical protein